MGFLSERKGQMGFGELIGYALTGILSIWMFMVIADPFITELFSVLDNSVNMSYVTVMKLMIGMIGFIIVMIFIVGLIRPLYQRYAQRPPQQY